MITKSSIVEIQNLVVNAKSRPFRSNSEQYQVLFKYVFQNKEKTLFDPKTGFFLYFEKRT